MNRRLHYLSGVIISIFVGLHLWNHVGSIDGADAHIARMDTLRVFYRNIFAESILLAAVLLQIISGWKLFRLHRKTATGLYQKLHVWSGAYLAVFFIFHISAVMAGRFLLHLDTNFYFGVAGLNTFPLSLFFIPYYSIAILSFFGHIAAIHHKKMRHHILGISPAAQSAVLLGVGIGLTAFILYGLTNHFNGVPIPEDYKILTGQM